MELPNINLIETVSATLEDRIRRLNIEISDLEGEAKDYASCRRTCKLTRDAKIAEATYSTVEQMKSQALQLDSKQILSSFQICHTFSGASSPKRILLLMFSIIIGITDLF